MLGNHLLSRDPAIMGDPTTPNNGERRPNKGAKADDATSTIIGDFLIILHTKFHIPNDVVTMVPKRTDRAGLPPLGYLTICETNLQAGLHFSPHTELIEIFIWCWMSLSQFLYRAILAIMVLIALFIDRGATLTPEHLLRMD
ncbi:hypothetical protein IEQ34_018895 [Dendrobium chrysotoxum]|uniref:Uncharacterized protein n=1 Tax=Dendrobium chrysotoxum TaxID=161865 RepID=A0AAV7G5Y2_DENCH|nr:hypothetical protein IEQ34_018895 [Dendrobium chrysotoxum]